MDSIADSIYRLSQGNKRFVSGDLLHPARDESQRLLTLNYGQAPFVAILSCADSRVPVEIIFDQGIGEMFSVRNAGNVCDDSIIGSIEMCVNEFNTPLVVCMGHTHCGAVNLAMTDRTLKGKIPKVIDKIRPVIKTARENHPEWDNNQILDEVSKMNAVNSAQELYEQSEIIRDRVKRNRLRIAVAIYHLKSGIVEQLDFAPK